MKLRIWVAALAAIVLTPLVAMAGYNQRQTDSGGWCLEETTASAITDRLCVAANGVVDWVMSTVANSAATNDYHEIALTTPVDTTGTNTHNALTVDLDIGNATGGTNTARGIQIDAITGDAQVTTVGINIGAMTGTAGTENAIAIGSGWDQGITSASSIELTGSATVVDSEQWSVPIVGQCKVGATAGWVITGGTDISHATLPASQTGSTLVCPLPPIPVGSTITAVAVAGQVESAGNNVTMTMSFRRLTNAAADNTDAQVATDNVGTLTADTKITEAELGVTGQAEVIAADESHYVLITATTAASTDIDLTHLLITYTSG